MELLQILILLWIVIIFMEQYTEKMRKEDNAVIFEQSEDDSISPNAQSSRQKKKIRKLHKKKKSRAVVHLSKDEIPIITQYLHDNSTLFTPSKAALSERYRQMVVSNAHVREVLSKSESPIFNTKQDDCQQETWRYIEYLNAIQESIYQKMGIVAKGNAFSLSLLRSYIIDEEKKGTLRNIRFLSSNQTFLYHKRAEIREDIRGFVQGLADELGYAHVELKDPELEILTLCKINNLLQHEILSKLSRAFAKEDSLMNCHIPVSQDSSLHNQYLRVLAIKNLEKAFEEEVIDFFNYHKGIENYEDNGHIHQQFDRIESFTQFKKYIFNKKPKLNKCSKYHLRTPCSACFSDFSEMSNPIQKCPECPIRVHKYCQKVENRCHRCRFGRTANEEKSQTGYCYICQRPREKGLMIRTVTNRSPHHFAHSFCLLIHNLWRIEDGEIKGQYVQTQASNSSCQICSKSQGILLNCEACDGKVHGMCAYLSGMSFRMQRDEAAYRVHVTCCRDQQLRERLSLQRRFKLNYQKVIFRQNKQLFDYIEKAHED